MMAFDLDLGTVPSVLRALQDPALAARAAKAMAQRYTSDIHDWIDAGRAFTPREGLLQGSVNWRPTPDGGEVYANADYARFVEQGTGVHAGRGPWVIGPSAGRRGLRFPAAGGGFIVRRAVTHPGGRAFPFFFADGEARGRRMQAAARSVLAQAAGGQDG